MYRKTMSRYFRSKTRKRPKNDLYITFIKKILDKLEWLEETVDEQELTISTLNEIVDCLESKLTEEKRNGSFNGENQSF